MNNKGKEQRVIVGGWLAGSAWDTTLALYLIVLGTSWGSFGSGP